jgi:hypothetical protein
VVNRPIWEQGTEYPRIAPVLGKVSATNPQMKLWAAREAASELADTDRRGDPETFEIQADGRN